MPWVEMAGQSLIQRAHADYTVREVLHIRHYSLFAPRDFDISPFFQVIKPEVDDGFSYRDLVWTVGLDERGR